MEKERDRGMGRIHERVEGKRVLYFCECLLRVLVSLSVFKESA